MKPVIFGLAGESLSAEESAFFCEAEPAGYILFKRNCGNKAQLRALTELHGTTRGGAAPAEPAEAWRRLLLFGAVDGAETTGAEALRDLEPL